MNETAPREIRTRCCIAGGGPAGIMLGLLLAHAGIDTVVLETVLPFERARSGLSQVQGGEVGHRSQCFPVLIGGQHHVQRSWL
jgi:2-polyprenyl-6-methoxyphenol hydroxylase-like FAD-dependent oxidoreductase